MNQTKENDSSTDTKTASKEGMAILEVGFQMNEFAAIFTERMIALEAHQHVTQDLLKTIMSGQGHSREKLNQECLDNYREYEKLIAAAYEEKLKKFQDRSEDIAKSIGGATGTPLNQFARKLLIAAEHNADGFAFLKKITEEINDGQLTEAVSEVIQNQLDHGRHWGKAFAGRPDVFSEDFIDAIKAADSDGDLVKHLRTFLKYDGDKN